MRSPTPPSERRRSLLRVGGLIAAAGLAGCRALLGEQLTERRDLTADPAGAGSVTVAVRNGDVRLSAGDGEAVSGTVVKRTRDGQEALDAVTVTSAVRDGTLVIEADHSAVPAGASVSVDLDLSVPASLPVTEAVSENGDVAGEGLAGDGTYRTVNGDVRAENVGGFVTAASENGDVTVTDPEGLDGARSTNGDLEVDVPALRGDTTCRTTNGDVTAAVSPGLDAAVTLRTANGETSVEGVELQDASITDSRVSGRLGEGANALELRSVNGDVELRER